MDLVTILPTHFVPYAGPRCVFACMNHDTDQPCKAVQQSYTYHVTCHMSGVTHVSGVMCHMLGVSCQVSGVRCHMSQNIYIKYI